MIGFFMSATQPQCFSPADLLCQQSHPKGMAECIHLSAIAITIQRSDMRNAVSHLKNMLCDFPGFFQDEGVFKCPAFFRTGKMEEALDGTALLCN